MAAIGARTAALAVLVPALDMPPHVDHVRVHNPYPWVVDIDITDARHDAWTPLGLIERNCTRSIHEVIDHGDRWTFRFRYSRVAVERTIDRTQLEADNWTIAVPRRFADALRARNIDETPI